MKAWRRNLTPGVPHPLLDLCPRAIDFPISIQFIDCSSSPHRLFSPSAGLSYNGPSIFAYQYQSGGSPDFGPHGPAGDQYLYTHFQVDAQAAFRVAPGLQFIFSGLNLTNSVFGFYNGSQQYVAQREFYKPTYEFGLRWNPSFEK